MNFSNYKNVSFALQFNQKRQKLTAAQIKAYDAKQAKLAETTAPAANDSTPDISLDKPTSLEDEYKLYNATVTQLVKYIGVNGLFELKDG